MQAQALLNIIRHPKEISLSDVKALEKLTVQYPYFQLAFILLAKAASDKKATHTEQAVQLAAIYATDRHYLKRLLEDQITFTSHSNEKALANAAIPQIPNTDLPAYTDTADAINSYINALRNKATQHITKRRSLEQLNIIENFIQQGGTFNPINNQDIALNQTLVDLSQANTSLDDDLLTESLAEVMIKQGKFQRAFEIYDKLQLKFPEKKSYFSALSQALKKETT